MEKLALSGSVRLSMIAQMSLVSEVLKPLSVVALIVIVEAFE